jgi:hypothetical protein
MRSPNRGEGSGSCFLEGRPDAARPRAAGLIEVEFRDRRGGGRVEGWRLVEVVGGEGIHRSDGIGVELECGLGRPAGGGESGRGVGQVEAAGDGADGPGAVRWSEDAVIAVAVGPGRRDQAREGFEKLERREGE